MVHYIHYLSIMTFSFINHVLKQRLIHLQFEGSNWHFRYTSKLMINIPFYLYLHRQKNTSSILVLLVILKKLNPFASLKEVI